MYRYYDITISLAAVAVYENMYAYRCVRVYSCTSFNCAERQANPHIVGRVPELRLCIDIMI